MVSQRNAFSGIATGLLLPILNFRPMPAFGSL